MPPVIYGTIVRSLAPPRLQSGSARKGRNSSKASQITNTYVTAPKTVRPVRHSQTGVRPASTSAQSPKLPTPENSKYPPACNRLTVISSQTKYRTCPLACRRDRIAIQHSNPAMTFARVPPAEMRRLFRLQSKCTLESAFACPPVSKQVPPWPAPSWRRFAIAKATIEIAMMVARSRVPGVPPEAVVPLRMHQDFLSWTPAWPKYTEPETGCIVDSYIGLSDTSLSTISPFLSRHLPPLARFRNRRNVAYGTSDSFRVR